MNKDHLQRAERLKFSDFFLVLDLCSQGSIGETARLHGLAPSQVSRRLKAIEKALGFRFFERSKTGVALTSEGSEALTRLQAVSEDFQALVTTHRRGKAANQRAIGFGATSFLLSYAAIPALTSLWAEENFQRMNLMAFNPDELLPSALDGAFQVVLHPNAIDWPRSWQSERVGHLRWGLFARSDHPLASSARRRKLREIDLAETSFVYPFSWKSKRLVMQADGCPLPPSRRLSQVGTQTAEQALHVVRRSHVVGFLPELMMRDAVAAHEVREIPIQDWPVIEQPIYLSIRPDLLPNAFFTRIMALIKARLKERIEKSASE